MSSFQLTNFLYLAATNPQQLTPGLALANVINVDQKSSYKKSENAITSSLLKI